MCVYLTRRKALKKPWICESAFCIAHNYSKKSIGNDREWQDGRLRCSAVYTKVSIKAKGNVARASLIATNLNRERIVGGAGQF
jgi:hypothetical protein